MPLVDPAQNGFRRPYLCLLSTHTLFKSNVLPYSITTTNPPRLARLYPTAVQVPNPAKPLVSALQIHQWFLECLRRCHSVVVISARMEH
jgi:hypothetical protein